jgi:hypothetical protein
MIQDTVNYRLLELEPAVCDAVNAMTIAVDFVEHLLNRPGMSSLDNAGVYALHHARHQIEVLHDQFDDACNEVLKGARS